MHFKFISLVLLAVFAGQAHAFKKLNVVTTTTDIQWLVEQIGGARVSVHSLLNGTEDPHYIDAMPHFVGKVAKADMFCLVGLDLELGWAPKVLVRSGNKQVQHGGKGYCETGKTVKALQVPKGKIDRTLGDVHPSGNPHFHLGPNAFVQGGETVLQVLQGLDPDGTKYYLSNFEVLKKNMVALKKKVSAILEPVKNKKYMEYHKEFSYFFSEFGLSSVGTIEAAPGVPPSAGRLARVSVQARSKKVAAALAAKTSPRRLTKKFGSLSKVPVARVSVSIEKRGKIKTYESLMTHIAQSLANASSQTKRM